MRKVSKIYLKAHLSPKNALSLYFDHKSIKVSFCLFVFQEIDPNYLINYLVYFWNREYKNKKTTYFLSHYILLLLPFI